ncbi:MAG: hypothetical protein AB7F19_06480 [Candidatus Babeliales bacterium]
MKRTYSFCVMLNLDYSEENIFSILENGSKLGCVYRDHGLGDTLSNIVNSKDATKVVLTRFIQEYEYGPYILAKLGKTHYTIWFYRRNSKIYLCIDPDHITWKKRYELCDWQGINFYRYQSFILSLVGNNVITHFKTYEYYNAIYAAEYKERDKKIYVKLNTYWAYDVYHHLKVNGKILGIIWLDAKMQPINIKTEDNTLENIIYDENRQQCWYALHNNIVLKFSLIVGPIFIIEPMSNGNSTTMDQAHVLDSGLRTTIELFKNMPVFRFITFKSDEDIININKMDDR